MFFVNLISTDIPKSDTDAVNRTLSRNGSILESVRQENREDINEIWNTPPPPPPSTLTPRPENGFHTNRRWDSPSPITTPTREVNSLPATRNLNSYFPWLGRESHHQSAHEYALGLDDGTSVWWSEGALCKKRNTALIVAW